MISNTNPSAKDVVIIQRDDNNALYQEVHISGSLVIPYLDANGHVDFDTSQSFYNIFPPPGGTGGGGTTLYTASTYQITASWAKNVVSSSWASQSLSASWADNAEMADTASYAFTSS